MGSILTRKNGRVVIQWIDGSGKQRQESISAKALDGRPLSARAAEQLARRRLAEFEEKARRQRHGLDPLPSESLGMTFGQLMDWWWEQKGKTLRSDMVRPFLEKHLRASLGGVSLREVTTARLQRHLADLSGHLSPSACTAACARARSSGCSRPTSISTAARCLNRMLRAAIARAGLVEGFEHRCRASHCGFKAPATTREVPESCPRCGKPTLWAKPIPRHVRFHDTRHSGGTAVVRSAGMAVAQKFLRHSDVRLTIHTYSHLDVEDVREGIARSFTSTTVKAGTAPGLQDGRPAPVESPPKGYGTAPGEAQAPVPSNDSPAPAPRTNARTALTAASARTRCSSAA